MGQRIEYIDIAKGLGIFCIVIGHNAIPHWLYNWVYSFHVPLFFIISGYFYRLRTMRETINKGWLQLIRPMCINIIIAQVVLAIIFVRNGEWNGPTFNNWLVDIMLMRDTGYVRGMWFLVALFWGKIWMCMLHKLGEGIVPIGTIGLFIVGYMMHSFVEKIPWCFDRGMCVPLFLYVGMLFNKYAIIEKLSSTNVFISALFILGISWLFPVDVSGMFYPYGIISVLFVFVVASSVLIVLKKWSELSSLPRNMFLYAGQNSLLILCIHSLIHTWQIGNYFLELLPAVGYVHRVWSWGIFAFAECVFLIYVVRYLNKFSLVNRVYHSRNS